MKKMVSWKKLLGIGLAAGMLFSTSVTPVAADPVSILDEITDEETTEDFSEDISYNPMRINNL